MELDFISGLFVFMLATFIGLDVIRRVSRLLHTPLMSLTNAISAIAIVGAIIVTGEQHTTAQHAPRRRRRLRVHDQHRQRLPDHGSDAEDVQETRAGEVTVEQLTQLIYLVSAGAFILSLKWMSDPDTARRGVFAGVGAMVLAVAGTLLYPHIVAYHWIAIAVVAGTLVGVPLSWVPLTAVPQRTALSHAFGGLAAGLVGTAKYYTWLDEGQLTTFRMAAIGTEVLLGYLTCTGSLMAAGKLQEVLPTRPLTYRNQNVINLGLLGVAIVIAIVLVFRPATPWLFPIVIVLSLLFGVLLVLPIGGADMPTVISLLNAYAGLSAVAMGFVLENKLLITAGALDGSSGLILSIIMCRAMNRSFTNVLFGAFGQVQAVAAARSSSGRRSRRRPRT